MNAPEPMLSIEETRTALVECRVDGRTLLQNCLAAIANPAGEGARAFIAVHAESAQRTCREAGLPTDAAPLAGIPISIKDLFDERGWVTTAGSRVLCDAAPAIADATIITRLRRAGAVIVGRTNMTEFAYSGVGLNPHYGTPLSPFDRATGRIPGGSSSGAAISVADGMSLAAIGTDTGGSVRIPAAFCGLVGFKPTVGRVPTDGAFPLAPSFDSVGPIVRSVADARLLDSVLSGVAMMTRRRELRELKIGVASGLPLDSLDAEVAAAFEQSIQWLGRAGTQVTDVPGIDWGRAGAILSSGRITAVEARVVHAKLFARRQEYDPRVCTRIAQGEHVDALDYAAACITMQKMSADVSAAISEFDAVLMPTVACVPPPLAALASDEAYVQINARVLRNTVIANVFGLCAISLPISAAGHAPVGLMLMAPAGRDAQLLDVAEAVERQIGDSYMRR